MLGAPKILQNKDRGSVELLPTGVVDAVGTPTLKSAVVMSKKNVVQGYRIPRTRNFDSREGGCLFRMVRVF